MSATCFSPDTFSAALVAVTCRRPEAISTAFRQVPLPCQLTGSSKGCLHSRTVCWSASQVIGAVTCASRRVAPSTRLHVPLWDTFHQPTLATETSPFGSQSLRAREPFIGAVFDHRELWSHTTAPQSSGRAAPLPKDGMSRHKDVTVKEPSSCSGSYVKT
jgi:hypothetical protein